MENITESGVIYFDLYYLQLTNEGRKITNFADAFALIDWTVSYRYDDPHRRSWKNVLRWILE